MSVQDQIIVKAKIRLRPTAEGGRMTSIKTGYRPNHVFEQTNDPRLIRAYMGEVQFTDQEFIQLGEVKTVIVRFLRNPEIDKYIHVGRKWFIYEGSRFVGEGEIIEL